MTTFADTKGRTWSVEITIDTVRRLRKRLGLDLLGERLTELLQRVLGDPCELCDVLFVVVEPEAQQQGITDEEFGRSMAGDALDAGARAFLDELVRFTPNPRDRERVGTAVQAILAAAEKYRDQAQAEVQRGAAQLLELVTAGALSSSSPASPASSPGASPSGS